MLFNSIDFLFFFPIVAIIYYIIPYRFRSVWLLVASYYFYMSWNPKYAVLILISTIVTYFSGILMCNIRNSENEKIQNKDRLVKYCLILCLLINLGILVYFKYIGFLWESVSNILSIAGVSLKPLSIDIVLPVGISFYTFQALGYSLDVYKGKIPAERNFIKYALFVSFFPQLVAGPIERSENLLAQLGEKHKFNFETIREGLTLMLWGYFLKMVVGDRIAIFVDTVYGDYVKYSGFYLLVATVLFAFQIYCDFAGYSVIAMGAAKVMGYRLTDNFEAPYLSSTVSEFWRNWHVSLFSWFKDYIYIPLGGSRNGKIRKYINILIVFLVSGIWHGASWGFVVWGLLNGIYQIVGEITAPIRKKIVMLLSIDTDLFGHKIYKVISTFVLVDFAWIFFRAGSFSAAVVIIKNMLRLDNIWVLFDNSLYNLGLNEKNFHIMIVAIVILLVADLYKKRGITIRDEILKQALWFRWMVLLTGIAVVFVFGIWGSGYNEAAFIYFQF